MLKVGDIADVLEQAAPLRYQESYDNAGLIVGDPGKLIESALICVDVTEEVVQEAKETGAGLIVSHHPLIFHPLKRFTGTTYIQRAVAEAIRADIALYACHTNLDSAPGGLSHRLGQMLSLEHTELLSPSVSAEPEVGFGIVGYLPQTLSPLDFLRLLKERLHLGGVRYSRPTRPLVERVAICSGSGASLMEAARKAGADVYVASDFKYNDFLDADRELMIADIGHFESEYCAIDVIFEIIRKKMPTFALRKSEKGVNPINYL